MRGSILQTSLKTALDKVKHGIENKPSLPVTSNVKLELSNSRLTITAVNLSYGYNVEVYIGANVDIEGAVTVNFKLLKEWADNQPADRIDFELDSITNKLTFTRGANRWKVDTIPAFEFPDASLKANGNAFVLSAGTLMEALKVSSIYVEKDGARAALNGLSVKLNRGSAEFASSNGYALAIATINAPDCKVDNELRKIVPTQAITALEKLITKNDNDILVSIENDYYIVVGDQWSISGQYIDARFPPYEVMENGTRDNCVTVLRKDFVSAIKQVAFVAKHNANQIILRSTSERETWTTADGGKLYLSASSKHGQGEVESIVDTANVTGESIDFPVAYDYLQDAMNCLSSDSVRLSMKDNTSVMVVAPVVQTKDINARILVMPMQKL
jgi:DNA polymerase-3 subunit beta